MRLLSHVHDTNKLLCYDNDALCVIGYYYFEFEQMYSSSRSIVFCTLNEFFSWKFPTQLTECHTISYALVIFIATPKNSHLPCLLVYRKWSLDTNKFKTDQIYYLQMSHILPRKIKKDSTLTSVNYRLMLFRHSQFNPLQNQNIHCNYNVCYIYM